MGDAWRYREAGDHLATLKETGERRKTDLCMCGNGSESTVHFLLLCPFFHSLRSKLFDTVDPFIDQLNKVLDRNNLSEILLYGHKDLNPMQNRSILLATLDYIQNTRRLSPE